MFQTILVKKLKAHILFTIFFFFENGAFYEIMCKNMVKPGRLKITIK